MTNDDSTVTVHRSPFTVSQFQIDERRRALARIAHNLKAAHDHLMLARSIDTQFALGLDLPSERPLVDAIAAAAVKLRGETAE